MFEGNIANPKDGTDGQFFGAGNPLVVDIGAVGRIQVRHAQLLAGQFDQAMRS